MDVLVSDVVSDVFPAVVEFWLLAGGVPCGGCGACVVSLESLASLEALAPALSC